MIGRSILAAFSHIVLVANSDAVDIQAACQAQFPSSALFVFFNKVYKVLDRPFHGQFAADLARTTARRQHRLSG